MNYLKFLLFVLPVALVFTNCGEDDTVVEPTITSCKLTDVNQRIDETTTFGLFNVAYEGDKISSSGLQTYDHTYDASGKLVESLLEESSLNPQVKFTFAYDGDQLTEIKSIWGVTNPEERYVYTVTYGGNGFVDKMVRNGLGGTEELDYDFDSNGNALVWTEPVFSERREYTFNGQKGLFEGLDHTLAFAYGVSICQPFWHFSNAVISEKIYTSNGSLDESSDFSNLQFNSLGFQTVAGDPNGETYEFEYECN